MEASIRTNRSEQDALRPRAAVRHLHHPDERPAAGGRAPRRTGRGIRLRPRHVPGPPLPAALPRHVDAAHVGRGPHRARPPRGQRRQPAAAPARRPRACRRQPRPAQRRSLRARARRRRLLGRHRRHGRPPPHARPGRRRALGGDRCHPRGLGPGRARPVRGRRRVLPRQRREARPRPRAQHPHLDRRAQAPDAAADRAEGRRLAAVAGLPEARRPRRGQPHDRRVRARRRTRPARDPSPREHRRPVLGRRGRVPRRPGGPVGRAAAAARARRRHRHVHPRERRPRDDAALRGRGRAGAARGGRARAQARGCRDRRRCHLGRSQHRGAREAPCRHRLRRAARGARGARGRARRRRVRPA